MEIPDIPEGPLEKGGYQGKGGYSEEEKRIRQHKLADSYGKTLGNISAACQEAGIGHATYYEWLKDDPYFISLMATAQQRTRDALRGALVQRGTQGHRTQLFHNGKPILDDDGQPVYEYHPSDQVLMMLARAHLPEHKADMVVRHEHTGEDGGPIQIEILLKQYLLIDKNLLTPQEKEMLEALAEQMEDRKRGDASGENGWVQGG
jgi:hypothetical protein